MRIFLGFFLLCASLQAQTALFFQNDSRNTLTNIEVRGGSYRQWSENLLPNPLRPQESIQIDLEGEDCLYQIRGKDEDGRTLFSSMRMDLCQHSLRYSGSYFLDTQSLDARQRSRTQQQRNVPTEEGSGGRARGQRNRTSETRNTENRSARDENRNQSDRNRSVRDENRSQSDRNRSARDENRNQSNRNRSDVQRRSRTARLPREIKVINRSPNESIHALYLRPSRSDEAWSENVLSGQTIFLSENEQMTLRLNNLPDDVCIFDLRAEGLGRKPLGAMSNIDLCEVNFLTLRFGNPSGRDNRFGALEIEIKNVSRSDNIHKLFIRPEGTSNWGRNRLTGITIFLSRNETERIPLPELSETCIFDFRAEGLGNSDLGVIRRVDVCSETPILLDF